MIKFFRQIRYNLMNSGQTTRYFKYAIGEIILVVIGILIALQINNANEKRKARLQEVTILENLQQDLYLDTLDINFNIEYHKTFITNEKKLLNFLQSDRDQPDEPIDYNAALSTPLVIVLHKSTFANLQNNDVGILTNNTLRKDIARFYDFFATAIQKIENEESTYKTYDKSLSYFIKYFELDPDAPDFIIDNPDSNDYYNPDFVKKAIALYDVEGAKKDKAFHMILNESIFFRQVKIDFYIDMVKRIKELNLAIDEELNLLR